MLIACELRWRWLALQQRAPRRQGELLREVPQREGPQQLGAEQQQHSQEEQG